MDSQQSPLGTPDPDEDSHNGGGSVRPATRARRFSQQALIRDPRTVASKRRRRLALRAVAGALIIALILGGGFLVKLRSNFATAPLTLGESQGDLNSGPLEILLLGTDTRSGSNAQVGGAEFTTGQGHSDVMMLLQISADRKHVTVVSFPRDTLVPLPKCTDPKTGKTYPAQDLAMLNYALSYGGPGCTVAAINKLTGLTIDHFMMADFTAVKELSNAVGGVEVCLNTPVKDPLSGLDLPAGISTIEGDQALAYLRTRHGFGDGGDIGRIRAQQAFMASLARKVKSEQTLTDLPKMYRIANTMTKSLTVDAGLSNIPTILAVSKQLSDSQLSDIAFVTLPTVPYEPDPNRLAVDRPKAERLFALLRNDENVSAPTEPSPRPSASATGGTPSESPTSPASPSPDSSRSSAPISSPTPVEEPTATRAPVDRSLLPLTAANASGDDARGREILQLLKKLGYSSASAATDKPVKIPTTQVLYQPGYEDAAADLADALKLDDAQMIVTSSVQGVRLVVGSDFTDGETVAKPEQSVTGGLSGQTANQVTCQQGNPNE